MDMNTMTLPKKGSKKDLEKLSKAELIELLLKQEKPKVVIVDDTKPVPTPRTYKSRPPVPTPRNKVNQFFENKPTPPPRTGKWENVKPKPVPRKSVKQMVKEYEDHIIQPPEQLRQIPKPSGLKDHFKCEDRQNPLESHHLHLYQKGNLVNIR